ncbi:MAG: hypothetical protein Ct9H300mP28_34490 [Pseudomonadota bacterium]|nr:MAG: hypothetical protein Ct9H300mP28_34490 [Pseudomonadota bacterium]
MKRVTRQEILDYVTYEEKGGKKIGKKIMKIKELRRINVAGVLSSCLKTLTQYVIKFRK